MSRLIWALRETAARLEAGSGYEWSHFGMCNCGNLAQVVTDLSAKQIYDAAFQRPGDWGEQAREFCPTSGYPMDYIVGKIVELGLELDEFRHLERLTHPRVLRRIPAERKPLRHTSREDTILFLRTWAELLEERAGGAVAFDEAAA